MSDPERSPHTRREMLTGDALRSELDRLADRAQEASSGKSESAYEPVSGPTLRLQTRAMACDFAIILNPEPRSWLAPASDALELVHGLEDQMTVYRPHSDLSGVNRRAADGPVRVGPELFEVVQIACRLAMSTEGCFDPTSGPLVALWRRCRAEGRIPTENELAETLNLRGVSEVELDDGSHSIRFRKLGMELNLGGIGKGFALDRVGQHLLASGVEDFLVHGGHSSLLAAGAHRPLEGWPVGIRNPLFPDERLGTLLLRNRALSSSGSGVQGFRFQGKRYGHILDPRTGKTAENLLSVTVIAPTAAEADALSTAFFVMGVEKAREYCDNSRSIGAIFVPPPRRGRQLDPVICGISDEDWFLNDDRTPDRSR